MPEPNAPPGGEILLYQTEDGRTRVECRFDDQNLWLSQPQLADLIQVTVPTISEHLKGIFSDGELEPERTVRNFRTVRQEGNRRVAARQTKENLTPYEQKDEAVSDIWSDVSKVNAMAKEVDIFGNDTTTLVPVNPG